MGPNLVMAIIFSGFLFMMPDRNISEQPCRQMNDNLARLLDENPFPRISAIPVPEGYTRNPVEKNAFAEWLRNVALKKNKTVFLYNGQLKANQTAQYAVLNISVGTKDLQQCADAIMRLRAEYLFSQNRSEEIRFQDNNGKIYSLGSTRNRQYFDRYLEKVFSYCGSLSLEKQLKRVHDLNDLEIGDVLIQGGSPGHAMILVDMAKNKMGKKIYLLAQSYMPAQDIHLVNNPTDQMLSPWYELNNSTIYSPEWTFPPGHFRSW